MPITDDLLQSTLQLEHFRQVLGINPYHFWQMHFTTSPVISCSSVYTHYRWVGERGPGRYDFIQAVNQAEHNLAKLLDYALGYNYVEHETVKLVQPRQVAWRITPNTLNTKYQRIINVGKRTWDLIGPVTLWAPPTPDHTNENISFTVNLAEATPACELKVCYPGTTVPIEPVSISISGLVATIVIKRWMLGKPADWESGVTIDADHMANLLTTVDVYHVWSDPAQQVTVAWEPDIYVCGCGSIDCPVCALALQTACAVQGIYKLGVVGWQPATFSNTAYAAVALARPRHPDLAFINYAHGLIDDQCYAPIYWRRVITLLALAYLDTGLCGCSEVIQAINYWQEDLSRSSDKQTFNISPSDLENPFGRRRGAINAWNAVKMSMGDDA